MKGFTKRVCDHILSPDVSDRGSAPWNIPLLLGNLLARPRRELDLEPSDSSLGALPKKLMGWDAMIPAWKEVTILYQSCSSITTDPSEYCIRLCSLPREVLGMCPRRTGPQT